VSGDKFSTIEYFWTLAMQMGQIWVGTGLLPASKKSSTPADVNWSSGFGGAHAISPADASVEEAPRSGDLETAKLFGKRVAELTRELN
jgi:NAD(P)H dehydrogenase (quinone)